jgi:hypothetical protein
MTRRTSYSNLNLLVYTLLLCLAMLTGCNATSSDDQGAYSGGEFPFAGESTNVPNDQPMSDPNWNVYLGTGYSMEHPADWKVSETDDNRILIESSQGRYTLTTVLLPGVRPDNLSPHMVQTCTGTGIDIRKFQRVNPFSMQASEDRGDSYETSAIMYQQAKDGITLMCATMVASKSSFDAFAATAGKVVSSMQSTVVRQGQGSNATSSAKFDWSKVPMVEHRDPEEGSYTVNIPQGWSFKGGTGRAHVLETRQWYIAQSPDGDITIIYGDVDVPRFVERDPFGMTPQGNWYTTSFSGNFFVWPYQNGLEFAKERVQNHFGNYENFKYDHENQLDMTRELSQAIGPNSTVGLSAFTFTKDGRAFSGAYLAATARYDGGVWSMIYALRIITENGREEEAIQLALKMLPTMDQQWLRRQNEGAMQNQRIMANSFAETNRIMRESYENRIASSERGTRDFVDAIWGTQRLQDPSTGQRYEMQHGSLSYWLHNDGSVVGTDSYNNPHPSHFTELMRVRN